MEGPTVKLFEWLGAWAGRVILGPILPPAGGIAGGVIGKKLGGMAGQALSSAMSGANDDAVPKEEAKDDADTCTTNCRTEECIELERQINRRLNANKRAKGPDGKPLDGMLGQFARRAEQICGASGPGTQGWINHGLVIAQQSGQLRDLKEAYENAGCPGHPDENINWDDVDRASSPEFNPKGSEWLGPNNAQCQTGRELIRANRAREALDLIERFPRPDGPAIF
jgi:hypothetical protein